MNYYSRYIKYKSKYLKLKQQQTGGATLPIDEAEKLFTFFRLSRSHSEDVVEFKPKLPDGALLEDDFTPRISLCHGRLQNCVLGLQSDAIVEDNFSVYVSIQDPNDPKFIDVENTNYFNKIHYIFQSFEQLITDTYNIIISVMSDEEFSVFIDNLNNDLYSKYATDLSQVVENDKEITRDWIIKRIGEGHDNTILDFMISYYTSYQKFPKQFIEKYVKYYVPDANSSHEWITEHPITMHRIGTVRKPKVPDNLDPGKDKKEYDKYWYELDAKTGIVLSEYGSKFVEEIKKKLIN